MFGMALDDVLPEGAIPLEAVVVVKYLDKKGSVDVWHTATPELNIWEAVGMVRAASLQLDRGLRGEVEEGEDEEEEGEGGSLP